jgi:hypothetical protein
VVEQEGLSSIAGCAGVVSFDVHGAGLGPPWMKRSPCSPMAGSACARTSMPMQQAAEAHRQLESGNVHQRISLTHE